MKSTGMHSAVMLTVQGESLHKRGCTARMRQATACLLPFFFSAKVRACSLLNLDPSLQLQGEVLTQRKRHRRQACPRPQQDRAAHGDLQARFAASKF